MANALEFWRAAIRRQFHASIDMLANAIEACPDSVWIGEGRAFWYRAYHVLIFLDLYLGAVDEPEFQPPAPFGRTELEEESTPPERMYTKAEILGYVAHCRKKLDSVMDAMTEGWVAHDCPIPFRKMSNGELLLYNMRHVQHHAAQLNLILRQRTNSAPNWVSKGPQHA